MTDTETIKTSSSSSSNTRKGRPLQDENDNRKKRPRKQTKLLDVPATHNYAVSFMHRSTITHVVTSLRHGYVLTASTDGIVKFWKRRGTKDSFRKQDPNKTAGSAAQRKLEASTKPCLEFVKSFTAHVGPVLALCMAPNGDTAASVGRDGIIKVYDIPTFDVTGMIKTQQSDTTLRGPNAVMTNEWIAVPNSQHQVEVYSHMTLSHEPLKVLSIHASPITAMVLNSQHNCVMTTDRSGVMEIWNTNDNYEFAPTPLVDNKSKTDTDYYVLMKKKTYAVALATSGTHYAVYGHDGKVRIYHHATGKIVCRMDERVKVYQETFSQYGMDALEYGKRAAMEREMEEESNVLGDNVAVNDDDNSNDYDNNDDNDSQQNIHQRLTLAFDPSGKYLLIPTLAGIKIVDWARRKLMGVVGKADATSLRFVHFCLCTGDAKVNKQLQLARSGGSSRAVSEQGNNEDDIVSDAQIVALSYNKRRLYVFCHKDPVQESLDKEAASGGQPKKDDDENEHNEVLLRRDVWNEAPDANDRLAALDGGVGAQQESKLGREAILRTTMGDIRIKLFPDAVPRTIENFCGHARAGYYDKVIFHRIIKGFMIQTGDPQGDGTGGESIWGGEFEDEFVRE